MSGRNDGWVERVSLSSVSESVKVAELKSDIGTLKGEHVCLKERVDALEKAFLENFGQIEAVSILKAAEKRILKIILEGSSDCDVKYYYSIRLVAEDEEEGCLPESISAKWQAYKPSWDKNVLKTVYCRLFHDRGAVRHRKGRDPQQYELLSLPKLREYFSSFGFRPHHLRAIEKAHSVTLVPSDCSPVDDA